jgi:hypothetical protein
LDFSRGKKVSQDAISRKILLRSGERERKKRGIEYPGKNRRISGELLVKSFPGKWGSTF